MEVREKWVEMMNAAMERHGHIQDPAQRLDARSWADQGRPDLAELREQKTLRGDGPEAMERHREIDGLQGAAGRAACAAPERGQGDRTLGTGEQSSRLLRCKSARPAS